MSDTVNIDSEAPTELLNTPEENVMHYVLPPNVMHDAVGELAEFILKNAGRPMVLDGSSVHQVGSQGAQLLAMATRSWAEEDIPFVLQDPNGSVGICLQDLGLSDFIELGAQEDQPQ